MEKRASTSSVSDMDLRHHHHHHHLHHPSSPFGLLCLQSDDPGENSLQLFGIRGEESTNASRWGMRASGGANQVFQSTSASSLDREASLAGHFDDSWFGNGKREVWVGSKDGMYGDASASCASSYCRGAAAGGNGDFYRSDSHVSDDPFQSAELEGSWLRSSDGEQKLDSFSEAFLSHRKRGCRLTPSWESAAGETLSSDSYQPPSLSSPVLPSLPSFPCTLTSSVSSVLSPPPTPLPPPYHSPSKTDSPVTSPGKESRFFTPFLQRAHTAPWKFESCDLTNTGWNPRASHDDDYVNVTGSLWPPSSGSPSPLPPHPPQSRSSDLSRKLCSAVPTLTLHQERNPPQKEAQICSGTSFPSVLHSRKTQRSHFTPPPLLNPLRKGAGLFSSIPSLHQREDQSVCAEEEEHSVTPRVNVGPDFQAHLPAFIHDGSDSSGGEVIQEHLLWKPWDELERNPHSQPQMGKLLSMCSSSCLPGGGSNLELALHCLHYCHRNTMDTLEMLLFSQPSPAGDYHYSGCDLWTDPEKRLFAAALRTCGKEFSLIKKTVKTKTVSQCVEFYYLSQKLQEKQRRHDDLVQQKRGGMQFNGFIPTSFPQVTPLCQPIERQYVLEEGVPAPSLAGIFPCKLCGKMFYKIKSRNAHMKIHRQPQEDWMDRRAKHLVLTHPTNTVPPPATAFTFTTPGTTSSMNASPANAHNSGNHGYPPHAMDPGGAAVLYSYIASPSSPLISSSNDSHQKEPSPVFPLHQTWSSFGHQTDSVSFYGRVGTEEANDQVNWE